MIITVYICCWMYMVHCRIELDEFWVRNAKSALQTWRNLLLAKFPQMKLAIGELGLPSQFSNWLVDSYGGM